MRRGTVPGARRGGAQLAGGHKLTGRIRIDPSGLCA